MPRTKQTARKSTVGTQRRATRAEKLELSHPQNKLTRFQTKLLETDPFPLMKLPLELREMVYLHAMMPASSSPADPRIKAQHHVTASKCPLLVCLNQLPASLVILRVNWKTHREAIEVFRKKFIFCLDPLDCRQLKRIPHHVHYQGIRKIAVACVAGYHLGGSQERDWLQRKNDDRMRYWARNLTGLREVELDIDVYMYGPTPRIVEATILRMAKAFKSAKVTIKLVDLIGPNGEDDEKAHADR